jgi:hypothetical protein
MIELMFVTCMSAAPEQCQDRSLLFSELGLMTCMVHGQSALAEWLAAHPRETVREWRCRPVGARQVKI